jgi:MYXO-CTERM domain-containing protein
MRFPPVFSRSQTGLAVTAIGLSLSLLSVSAFCDTARASGPVERLIQVLNDPSDPSHVLVRYGIASQGYLFSQDGGKTFRAMCSQAITPTASESDKLKRISSQAVSSVAPTLLDGSGKLWVGQTDGLWSDDGTGCTWAKQPDFDKRWPTSLLLDPQKPAELLALVTVSSGEGELMEAESRLMRRAADGTWTPWSGASAVKKHVAMQRAYGGQLVGASSATGGSRLYASLTVSVGALTADQVTQVVTSEDGGKTWTDAGTPAADQQEGFTLLAVDPLEPKRVLATVYRDSATDTLLLSEDAGKTFKSYGDVGETRGAVFAPDGRVFVGDAGSDPVGGVWTAARLGAPLTLIAGSTPVDCIGYKADLGKLEVCLGSRFGLLDPGTGVFDELTSLVKTDDLLDCPGVDMLAVCKTQLNAGASWCCAGHYPFTPFCGEYDVTSVDGRRVYCGTSGRVLDQMNGLGPTGSDADAGTKPSSAGDAGKPIARDGSTPGGSNGPALIDEEPRKRDAGTTINRAPTPSDGCSCSVRGPSDPTGGLAWTLAALAALLVRARRLDRAPARTRRPS